MRERRRAEAAGVTSAYAYEHRQRQAAEDPRPLSALTDVELSIRALDAALYHPGRYRDAWPPALVELHRRRRAG